MFDYVLNYTLRVRDSRFKLQRRRVLFSRRRRHHMAYHDGHTCLVSRLLCSVGVNIRVIRRVSTRATLVDIDSTQCSVLPVVSTVRACGAMKKVKGGVV